MIRVGLDVRLTKLTCKSLHRSFCVYTYNKYKFLAIKFGSYYFVFHFVTSQNLYLYCLMGFKIFIFLRWDGRDFVYTYLIHVLKCIYYFLKKISCGSKISQHTESRGISPTFMLWVIPIYYRSSSSCFS